MYAENFHQTNLWGPPSLRSYSLQHSDFQLGYTVAVQNIALLAFAIKCCSYYYSDLKQQQKITL